MDDLSVTIITGLVVLLSLYFWYQHTRQNTAQSAGEHGKPQPRRHSLASVHVHVVASMHGMKLEEEFDCSLSTSGLAFEDLIRSELGVSPATPLKAVVRHSGASFLLTSNPTNTFSDVQQLLRLRTTPSVHIQVTEATVEEVSQSGVANGPSNVATDDGGENEDDDSAVEPVSNKAVPSTGGPSLAKSETSPSDDAANSAEVAAPEADFVARERVVVPSDQFAKLVQFMNVSLIEALLVPSRSTVRQPARGIAEDGVVTEVRDSAHFQRLVQSATTHKRLLLVDFFATWCGPCVRIAPFLSQLAGMFHGKLLVVKVDVDRHRDLAGMFGVRAMPTFHFMLDGNKVDSVQGANDQALMSKTQQLVARLPAIGQSGEGDDDDDDDFYGDGSNTGQVRSVAAKLCAGYGKPLSEKAATAFTKFNTKVKKINSSLALSTNQVTEVRMFLQKTRDANTLKSATPAIVASLSMWPLDLCFPVLDGLRHAAGDARCAALILQNNALMECLCGFAVGGAEDETDEQARSSILLNASLAWKLCANLVDVVYRTKCSQQETHVAVAQKLNSEVMDGMGKLMYDRVVACGDVSDPRRGAVCDAMVTCFANACCVAIADSHSDRNAALVCSVGSCLVGHTFWGARLLDTPFQSAQGFNTLLGLREANRTGNLGVEVVKLSQSNSQLTIWMAQNKVPFLELLNNATLGKEVVCVKRKEQMSILVKLFKLIKLCARGVADTNSSHRLERDNNLVALCKLGASMVVDDSGPRDDKLAKALDEAHRAAEEAQIALQNRPYEAAAALPNPWK